MTDTPGGGQWTRQVAPKYIFELTLLGTNTVVFLRNTTSISN